MSTYNQQQIYQIVIGWTLKFNYYKEHLFHQAWFNANQDGLRHHLQILELTQKK